MIKEPGKTHLIVVEVEATDKSSNKTTLMYAHFDKQPPLDGLWDVGLGSRTPVIKGDLLFGRGASDDGYGSFAAVLSIKACHQMKILHPRILLVFESCEESDKDDLKYYLDKYSKTKFSKIDSVICLDSDAATADRLWATASLRGIIGFELSVKILNDSVHSGDAGGIVPDTFRICRELLDRLEKDGKLIEELYVKIPEIRVKEAEQMAAIYGSKFFQRYPWIAGGKPETEDVTQALLNYTWRPSLAITGAEGLPSIVQAGNVLRAYTKLKLSIRIPPHLDADKVSDTIIKLLTKDPPYGAEVSVTAAMPCAGWNANEFTKEFNDSLNRISKVFCLCY